MAPPWADQPYPLISTLPFSKDNSHAANYVATQMSLAHNGMIRGLNSVWIQAPNIPKSNQVAIRDFLIYIQCWSESMQHHHDEEEQNFFPALESLSGVKGLMERNIEQHREFTPGFEAFHEYAKTVSPGDFDGMEVRRLVEGFAEPLTKHLREEIDTLRGLDKYDSGKVRQAYKVFEKRLMDTDNYRIGPLVFGTADRNFENGMHDFPSVPFFVPYVIHYIFGRKYRGAWRYNPCTAWRDRKELAYPGESNQAG